MLTNNAGRAVPNLLLMLTLVLMLPALRAAAQTDAMPRRVGPTAGRAWWVSLDGISSGEAAEHLLGLEAKLAARSGSETGCMEVGTFHSIDSPVPNPTTVQEVVRQNNSIVVGNVTGVEPGIFASMWKGHLVRIRVASWLRLPENPVGLGAPADLFTEGTPTNVFFYYAGGAMTTADGVDFCRQEGWADPPEIGARVMVFSQMVPSPLPGGAPNDLWVGTTPEAKDIVFDTPLGVRTSPGLQALALFRSLDFDFIQDDIAARANRQEGGWA